MISLKSFGWLLALAGPLLVGCAPATEDENDDASGDAISRADLVFTEMPAGISACPTSDSINLPNASWLAWF